MPIFPVHTPLLDWFGLAALAALSLLAPRLVLEDADAT